MAQHLTPPELPPFLRQVYDYGHSTCLYDETQQDDAPTLSSSSSARTYVTLTFAQSLDAKIAGPDGKQLALSGRESMIMTHWMRTLHDGILIGIGTALNDDPQLNTRHLPPLPAGLYSPQARYNVPRPIILDAHLRLSHECKLIKNYRAGDGRRPWVVCMGGAQAAQSGCVARRKTLESAGVLVIQTIGKDGALTFFAGLVSITDLLTRLYEMGIHSLMVEGGARVIKSFLADAGKRSANGSKTSVVDTVVITVAPTLVGKDGIGYGSDLAASELPALEHVETQLFGRDAVIALRAID
ncbi:bacterial bifunctional deaminase-reductase [Laetiporus sulphureus 93-53]|uniref:2,5-diamino-6-ribosylamino-4(3H)-pyrimidinone 5'-phosphate reductase n=1 Tax=Laetiporus sulphureus 93-53 TaxID=1314785 RepID=A0A165F9V2_9APHY|nr:bacterial bifunctional deaminase-reductase [Laetiporus sulphureus 93-53]KZT08650.1 bacterial bifunctional deaminase-reductase [Laetiporus sulphureus 93-53]